jgi:D-alanine--D-alanine ligase
MAIPYTGSDAAASRAAMDKLTTKQCFHRQGIRTPAFAAIDRRWPGEQQTAAARSVGFPMIVKPAAEGSSVGVTKVERQEQLPEALTAALDGHRFAMAEEFIPGRELTVGILHDRPLPIIELIYQGELFDYHNKYTPGATEHVIDPDLPLEVAEDVSAIALAAHESLGCKGVTRVDLRLEEAGDPYVLEVNTIPGMTETSLIPDAARAAGIPFPRLCEMIVEMALRDRTGVMPWRAAFAHSVGA